MPEPSTFQLLDLGTDYALEFPFFPEMIRVTDKANWEPQDTTIGTKPLFYANGEPMQISVQDLYMDATDTNRSLKYDIDLLRLLKTEDESGPPLALLAIWGDNRIRCVLADMTVEETMFNEAGNCTRAKIGIELTELQDDGESTSVRESDYNENVEPG